MTRSNGSNPLCHALLLCTCALSLAACVPASTVNQSATGQAVQSAASSFSLPPPARTIQYTEDEAFARQVSASMRGGISPIKVNFAAAFDVESAPTALDRWYYEIQETEGKIISCPAFKPKTRSLLLSLALWVAGQVWDRITEGWLYRPAASYHAINYVEEDQRTVVRVEFVERGPQLVCP